MGGARWRYVSDRWFLGAGGDIAWLSVELNGSWKGPHLLFMVDKHPAGRFFHGSLNTDIVWFSVSAGPVSFTWWKEEW